MDDEQHHLTMISALLEKGVGGCVVATAQSGPEGIKKAKEELPDTILLDVKMPGLDGFEVCKRLKADQVTEHVPVIMLTGFETEVESRIRGLEAGADAYLAKPVDIAELRAQIKTMVRMKKANDRLLEDRGLQQDLVQERTKALKESQRAFSTLTGNLPGMVYRRRRDGNWTMEFASRGCLELTGYSPADIIERKRIAYADLILPNDRERVLNGVQKATAEKRPFSIAYRIQDSEGCEKWVLDQGSGVSSPGGSIVAIEGFIIDITARKQAEERSLAREQMLTQIIQGNPVATFIIDKNHTITYWNNACELLTGLSAQAMVGTKNQWKPFYGHKRPVLADLVVDNDISHLEEFYQGKQAAESKIIPRAWEAQDFFERLGGTSRHVAFLAAPIFDADGAMVGAVETLQDTSRQKDFEQELLQSEERYRVLTEQVADGVVVSQDEKLVFVNDAFVSMLGYDGPQQLLGTKTIDLISDGFKPQFKHLKGSFEEGAFCAEAIQMKCLKKDGSEFWVEAHNRIINWQGKDAVLATVRDITETKLREVELQQESETLRAQNTRLKGAIKDRYKFQNIVGKSPAMQEVYEQILRAAETNANVIVYGESGTGKELIAKSIHDLSPRRGRRFVAVNCGAIPENLLESEFFGHKKGAFTGADFDKHGYLDSADGGSLFLDEVVELGPNMQVKLLRAIDGGGYTPLGETTTRQSDSRIIAATNQNPKDLMKRGLLREDFFYRIHVVPITSPPLRERKEDIPLLVEHFLGLYGEGRNPSTLPGRVLDSLYHYDWPGNVRELQNVLHRYLAVRRLDFVDSRAAHVFSIDSVSDEDFGHGNGKLRAAMEAFEKRHITYILDQNHWNRTRTALTLGLSRKTLFRKMKTFGLQ